MARHNYLIQRCIKAAGPTEFDKAVWLDCGIGVHRTVDEFGNSGYTDKKAAQEDLAGLRSLYDESETYRLIQIIS